MRLIDADALIKRHCEDCKADVQESCKTDAVCSLLIWLAEEPTVDAVPVVRCKNCGAYQTKDVPFPRCRITGRMKGTDDYCSSGYTEDGGAND